MQTRTAVCAIPVVKGYYYTEADLVREIRKRVGHDAGTAFKTVECSIMDVADDIAYSTYDFEDALKAHFFTAASIFALDRSVFTRVAETVRERLKRYYPESDHSDFDDAEVAWTLTRIFGGIFNVDDKLFKRVTSRQFDRTSAIAIIARHVERASERMAKLGYYRTRLTSDLVGVFIRGTKVVFNPVRPALSKVLLDVEIFKQVEILKNFTFQGLIMSPMLKVAEHRGKDIVTRIFEALTKDSGHLLMPDDFQNLYHELSDQAEQQRVICDFIAGMTDRYAIQFYGRLYGTNQESIYSPL